MEELFGPVHDIDLLAFKGNPLGVFPRRRVNSDNPNEGHIILNNQEFIDLGINIIKKFKLSWLYDCDFMFNKNGEPVIIEINPRQSGSVAVVLAAGYSIMDALLELAIYNKTTAQLDITSSETKIIPYKNLTQV